MTTEFDGIIYNGIITGRQAFNNGDVLGYYINVTEYGDIVDFNGKVKISISDLYINTWREKNQSK